jgi:hypothetical protein
MPPHIDHSHISRIAYLYRLRLCHEPSCVVSDGVDEIVAAIGICAALRHESPTFLQPAALPTELPGNLVQPKRGHSNMNWWGGGEPFLQRDGQRQQHISTTRRNLQSDPHPKMHPCCLMQRRHSASPRSDRDSRCHAWYRRP